MFLTRKKCSTVALLCTSSVCLYIVFRTISSKWNSQQVGYLGKNHIWKKQYEKFDTSFAKAIDEPMLIPLTQGKYGVPISGYNYTVIYNKVPKCGSRNMEGILYLQAKRRHIPITVNHSDIVIVAAIKNDQTALAKELNDVKVAIEKEGPAVIYTEHFYYTPIKRSKHPVYINIIRDPLDKMISSFYFLRYGDDQVVEGSWWVRRWRKILMEVDETNRVNETFDQCVLRGKCMSDFDLSYTMMFFCGAHPRCRTPSKWALEQAKARVENEYLIVGTLEDLDSTLQIMEKLAPDLLTGIVDLYRYAKTVIDHAKFKSHKREAPSAEVVAIMRKKLNYEYQFYEFVKSKLENLKQKYGIS